MSDSERDADDLLPAGEIRRNLREYLVVLNDEMTVVQESLESLDDFDDDEQPGEAWLDDHSPPGRMPLDRWKAGEYNVDEDALDEVDG